MSNLPVSGNFIKEKNFKYRTSFGDCSSKATGTFALKIVKEFEKRGSLWNVKKIILRKKMREKYFVSYYDMEYNPLLQLLKLNFQCPKALMKVQVLRKNGERSYHAILVTNGQLFDSSYEVLLRAENKLKKDLPYLAIPIEEIGGKSQMMITTLVKEMREDFRQYLSEMILSNKKKLTIIFSLEGQSSSAFMGRDDWFKKMSKLKSIVKYMRGKKKIPSTINLTNLKKIVVKFKNRS